MVFMPMIKKKNVKLHLRQIFFSLSQTLSNEISPELTVFLKEYYVVLCFFTSFM